MKNKNFEAIVAENRQLKRMVKRIYLALMNPEEKHNPDKKVVVQWTPKEEAVVREEMANHGSIQKAYPAMRNSGLMRSQAAVTNRWYSKISKK